MMEALFRAIQPSSQTHRFFTVNIDAVTQSTDRSCFTLFASLRDLAMGTHTSWVCERSFKQLEKLCLELEKALGDAFPYSARPKRSHIDALFASNAENRAYEIISDFLNAVTPLDAALANPEFNAFLCVTQAASRRSGLRTGFNLDSTKIQRVSVSCKNQMLPHLPSHLLYASYAHLILHLDLSRNELIDVEGLNLLTNLTTLLLNDNKLSNQAISRLRLNHIHTLHLHNNQIENLKDLMLDVRRHFPCLAFFSIHNNPCCFLYSRSAESRIVPDYSKYIEHILRRSLVQLVRNQTENNNNSNVVNNHSSGYSNANATNSIGDDVKGFNNTNNTNASSSSFHNLSEKSDRGGAAAAGGGGGGGWFSGNSSMDESRMEQYMEETKERVMKLCFNGRIQKLHISADITFVELHEVISRATQLSTFDIEYTDAEGDQILLACDDDLEDAWHCSNRSKCVLKCFVQPFRGFLSPPGQNEHLQLPAPNNKFPTILPRAITDRIRLSDATPTPPPSLRPSLITPFESPQQNIGGTPSVIAQQAAEDYLAFVGNLLRQTNEKRIKGRVLPVSGKLSEAVKQQQEAAGINVSSSNSSNGGKLAEKRRIESQLQQQQQQQQQSQQQLPPPYPTNTNSGSSSSSSGGKSASRTIEERVLAQKLAEVLRQQKEGSKDGQEERLLSGLRKASVSPRPSIPLSPALEGKREFGMEEEEEEEDEEDGEVVVVHKAHKTEHSSSAAATTAKHEEKTIKEKVHNSNNHDDHYPSSHIVVDATEHSLPTPDPAAAAAAAAASLNSGSGSSGGGGGGGGRRAQNRFSGKFSTPLSLPPPDGDATVEAVEEKAETGKDAKKEPETQSGETKDEKSQEEEQEQQQQQEEDRKEDEGTGEEGEEEERIERDEEMDYNINSRRRDEQPEDDEGEETEEVTVKDQEEEEEEEQDHNNNNNDDDDDDNNNDDNNDNNNNNNVDLSSVAEDYLRFVESLQATTGN